MSVMNTFSGKRFDPMNMTSEDICTEDIAHALSLLCRGGGHLAHFYSVGQHSLNCAKEAKARGWSERLQLACLLHDASEAYISDIIRPVKVYLTNYLEIEEKIMGKIWEKYGLDDLSEEERRKWKAIDDDILAFTLKQNLPGSQKSANYPYEGFETFYGLNRKAYMAATGASQPRAFNFFRYALILRSRLN